MRKFIAGLIVGVLVCTSSIVLSGTTILSKVDGIRIGIEHADMDCVIKGWGGMGPSLAIGGLWEKDSDDDYLKQIRAIEIYAGDIYLNNERLLTEKEIRKLIYEILAEQ